MGTRWRAFREAHSWRWWPALGSAAGVAGALIAVVGLIVAYLAWQAPKSPEGQSIPSSSPTSRPSHPPVTTASSDVARETLSFWASSAGGAGTWSSQVSAWPNLPVTLLVNYQNQSSDRQDNVHLRVELPTQMTYQAGSSTLGNAAHPNGVRTDDGISAKGLNVGSYQPGGNAWVIFSVALAGEQEFPCSPRTLSPLATATDQRGTRSVEVTVTVQRRC